MGALAAPMPKLTIRPACQVMGWSERQKADWGLAIAARDVPALEARLAAGCTPLAAANRMGGMKRFWQAKAFRSIIAARTQSRAARKALAAAQTRVRELDLRDVILVA